MLRKPKKYKILLHKLITAEYATIKLYLTYGCIIFAFFTRFSMTQGEELLRGMVFARAFAGIWGILVGLLVVVIARWKIPK